METDKLAEINVKIAEMKKRILLTEGQKTAKSTEWNKQICINTQQIVTLKKQIKELTTKFSRLKNPAQNTILIRESNTDASKSNDSGTVIGRASYPIGAKTLNQAIFLSDLKCTEYRKALDLLRHHTKSNKQRFCKLLEEFRELTAIKDTQAKNGGERPAETVEEHANRKLVCQLENEIHRTNVQWMEAEHIRKKYRSIEASLMNDAERFERSLQELEKSLTAQQLEIKGLQEVHTEAAELRDAAKIIMQRHEQQAHLSLKKRERQAMDFRNQVEQRKLELERIGRKLFIERQTMLPQDSIDSSSGEPLTTHSDFDVDQKLTLENITSNMEELFKTLMEVTGAISATEVLMRFCSQKESAVRLTYLRNTAESEKGDLETHREQLIKELELSKFSDVKETEVNQEVMESYKNKILNRESDRKKTLEAAEQTINILTFINEQISEMIYRLGEGSSDAPGVGAMLHDCKDMLLIQVLIDEIKRIQNIDSVSVEKNREALGTPDIEKLPPMPLCYSLLAGRSQVNGGAGTSSSPEQIPAAVGTNDEDSEVPSRTFLKRQSVLIIEAKSRRKGYRVAVGGRRR